MQVVISRPALATIEDIYAYLCEIGYPGTAAKYKSKMNDFILSLEYMPERYSLCRFAIFRNRNLRCVVFDKHWMIVYKVMRNQVIVRTIIHTSRLK